MNRTRRLILIATGAALAAGGSLGVGAAQADTTPVTTLHSDYIACAGVDGSGGVCVEHPSETLKRVPGVRQVVYDLTGIG